jgi:hypothetical protein
MFTRNKLTSKGDVEYPAEQHFVFNPAIVWVKGSNANAKVTVTVSDDINDEVYSEVREVSSSGEVVFDISAFMQMHFGRPDLVDVSYGIDYDRSGGNQSQGMLSPFSRLMYISLTYEDASGVTTLLQGEMITGIWGYCEQSYDEFTYRRKQRTVWLWDEYPATLDFLARGVSDDTLDVTLDYGRYNSVVRDIEYTAGRYLVPITLSQNVFQGRWEGGELIDIAEGDAGWVEHIKIVAMPDCGGGVYLRWLDNLGGVRYFLFKKVGEELEASADEWQDGTLRDTRATFSYVQFQMSGRQSFSRRKIVTLGVKLANKDMREHLVTLLSSPQVDVFDYWDDDVSPYWHRVQVEPSKYTDNGKEMQDFVVKIIDDQYNTQR